MNFNLHLTGIAIFLVRDPLINISVERLDNFSIGLYPAFINSILRTDSLILCFIAYSKKKIGNRIKSKTYYYNFDLMKSSNILLSTTYKEHPRHYVAVDCVVFGYDEGELKLLLYPRSFEPSKGNWSLPGGFVQDTESSDQAAARVLKKTTGLGDVFMEQVAAFTDPGREQAARVISLAYYALVRLDKYDENHLKEHGASWCALTNMPQLIFDHGKMVEQALAKLQYKAGIQLVGVELLPEMFTLTQLRRLYEAILQRELDPGNFRKKILSLGILKKSNEKDSTESKKGAYFYTYHPDDIQEKEIGRIIKI